MRRSALYAFGTALPPYAAPQSALADWMSEALQASPALNRWLQRLYATSGIETRHFCLPDAAFPPLESAFAPGRPLNEIATTADRMAVYEPAAITLGTTAATRALEEFASAAAIPLDAAANAVTHLIAVSCTGFFAPGLDQVIARQLGLCPTVERTLIGFMGCAAAFNALRLARQIVASQPTALVLIVCVELCSLHVQPGEDRENLLAAAIFADGAAACLVGAIERAPPNCFVLEGFYTGIQPNTADEMVWQIGNHGFTLRLSPRVPVHLGSVAPAALQRLFDPGEPPQFWAIHPGGRAIVQRLAEIFALTPDQVAPSLTVLRNYGNLSSPTILFVLDEQRRCLRQCKPNAALPGVAMAFGPGLVIEMARLSYLPLGVAQSAIPWHSEEDRVEQMA